MLRGVKALIRGNEVVIKGIATHIVAEVLTKDLRDLLAGKRINVYFLGSPKPLGEGFIIRVVFPEGLSSNDLVVIRKFLELKGIEVTST